MAGLTLSVLAESVSGHSSPILTSLSSRRLLVAVSAMLTKWSRAHAVARSGSLWTHYGVASDLVNAERRAAMRRSYRACYLAACSSSKTTTLEP